MTMPADAMVLHRGSEHTRSYYSTILDFPADAVWEMIRDFNNYPAYVTGVTESILEDDKPGDEVGAVRCFIYNGARLRQELTGHSDEERWFTHAGCDPLEWPGKETDVAGLTYENAVHVIPLTNGNRTFIEWWMDYTTSDDGDLARWKAYLDENIPLWIESLREHLESSGAPRSRTGAVLIVPLKLQPGVDAADYERFAREVDKPTCESEQIPSIVEWHVHRAEPLPGSDERPPYDYVEVLQITSGEELMADLQSEVVAQLGAQLGGLVEEPTLILSKQIL